MLKTNTKKTFDQWECFAMRKGKSSIFLLNIFRSTLSWCPCILITHSRGLIQLQSPHLWDSSSQKIIVDALLDACYPNTNWLMHMQHSYARIPHWKSVLVKIATGDLSQLIEVSFFSCKIEVEIRRKKVWDRVREIFFK